MLRHLVTALLIVLAGCERLKAAGPDTSMVTSIPVPPATASGSANQSTDPGFVDEGGSLPHS